MRGTSVGVQRPSSPASSSVGWSELFGQTFMHSPQRMQRERNSDSSSEPGGRISRSWRLLPRPVLARMSGTAAAPAARPVTVRRRPRSGPATSCSLRKKRNWRLPCGQESTQFMHMRHSDLRQGTPPMGSSPPWQCSRQRLHLSHAAGSLCRPRMDQRETKPRSAPSGQIARHQKRVTRRLAARIMRNRTPSTRLCGKCAWRKSRTVKSRRAWEISPVLFRKPMWLCSRGSKHGADGEVEGGEDGQAEGTNQEAEGIEPAERRRAETGSDQAGDRTTYLPVCQRL